MEPGKIGREGKGGKDRGLDEEKGRVGERGGREREGMVGERDERERKESLERGVGRRGREG